MDFLEKIGYVLLIICIGLLAVMMIYGFFHIADTWFLPNETNGEAYVVNKEFIPGHYQTVLVGKVITNQWYPPEWKVELKNELGCDWVSVCPNFFQEANLENKYRISYKIKRFSKWLFITGVYERAK
jgi:hypothetical protein